MANSGETRDIVLRILQEKASAVMSTWGRLPIIYLQGKLFSNLILTGITSLVSLV
jgi:hypothetical protein